MANNGVDGISGIKFFYVCILEISLHREMTEARYLTFISCGNILYKNKINRFLSLEYQYLLFGYLLLFYLYVI